jgi:hypothetical protein
VLTDVKHALSHNPLSPAYVDPLNATAATPTPHAWHAYPEGLRRIGHEGPGFAFDCERPRHRVFVEAFEAGAVAVGWVAGPADTGVERPTLLGAPRRKPLRVHAGRSPTAASRGARLSRELLRGRRLCALVGRASPDRSRVGMCRGGSGDRGESRRKRMFPPGAGRGERREPGPALRGRLGVDLQPLRPVPRLPATAGPRERVQRQIHV